MKFQRTRLTWSVPLLATLAACSSPPSPPTYHEDVRSILMRRCFQCHAGGVSTYRPYFTDPEEVARVSGLIAQVVATRDMPPWAADGSGACNQFAHSQWLTEQEIDTVVRWAEAGAPLGDPARASAVEPFPEPPPARADAAVRMREPYSIDLGERLHRCFVVDPALEEERALTAWTVQPGNWRIVQHLSLWALDSTEAEEAARSLESEDELPGYHCFSSPKTPDARLVGTWVWGTSTVRYPEGTGIPLRAGHALVMQVHYSALGDGLAAMSDQTAIELELSDAAQPAELLPVRAARFELEPGTHEVEVRGTQPVAERLVAHGVYPVLHSLGHSMRLEVRSPTPSCLVQVPHWDLYNHMQIYWFDQPQLIEAGSAFEIACEYDTSSRTAPVRTGESYYDEECAAHLYLVRNP